MAILQARMGSNRLPGKVLEDLGGVSVLNHCLRRASAIKGIDAVCLATTLSERDDPVAEAAARTGATVFRGSEDDVLSRYAGAARMMQADVILRATCDCPLLDPEVCGAVLDLRSATGASYAANNFRREWPHGLDCEVFTREALEEADRLASDPYDREHVGPYMRRKTMSNPVHLAGPDGDAAIQRWTLDYPEDLTFLLALWPLLPQDRMASWRDVMTVVRRQPALSAINAMHAH